MPKFEREVEIDAPVEKVWEVITDPKHWQQWFPGVNGAVKATSINEGARFEWTSANQNGKGTIEKMEPKKYLEITTQVGDDKDAHVFKLKPSGGILGLEP